MESIQSSNRFNQFNLTDREDVNKLLEIVMQGLGMSQLPDISKMNISQMEYATKYNEYLSRIRDRKRRELIEQNNLEYLNELNGDDGGDDDGDSNNHYSYSTILTSYVHNASSTYQYRKKRSLDNFNNDKNIDAITRINRNIRRNNQNNIVFIRFPLKIDENQQIYDYNDIEEANLRLMLITDPISIQNHSLKKHSTSNYYHMKRSSHQLNDHHRKHILNFQVYQLIKSNGKIWLDSKQIEINMKMKTNRWLDFDVTKATETWLNGKHENLGLEIHCDNCHLYGSHIVDDLTAATATTATEFSNHKEEINDQSPVLNIIERTNGHREKRSRQHHHLMPAARKKRKTDCYEGNQKCCRHSMEVVFREIKGFEFIIQPKIFDAGYCRGKCPPRYNPAHNHAVLQSLIWKQDHSKAPRPCCAPSKLVELEILHVDEKDSRKLKVSTWNDMKVVECGCS